MKLAFAFFNLQRFTVRFGALHSAAVSMPAYLFSKYFLHANRWKGMVLGSGDTMVRKTRQRPGPHKV